MTSPGSPTPPGSATPPEQNPAPQATGVPYPGTPQPESKVKKWAGLAGGVVVAGVVGASWLGFGGPGEPEVGDCVTPSGETSFEVVDCDSAEAEARVVGIQEGRQTEDEFMTDPDSCSAFPAAEMSLWVGDIGGKGTVLCAEPA